MTSLHRGWPVALTIVVLGCSVGGNREPGAAASQPVTSAARKLNFSRQAIALDQFRDDDHDIDLQNVLSFGESDIYFGQVDRIGDKNETLSTIPIIVAMRKGEWVALNVDDYRLKNAEWQFVASGPADGEIWGVLDDTIDDDSPAILLAHSLDSGLNWTVAAINKPFASGQYDSFRMDKTGRGRLSVYVDGTKKSPDRAGFYHFHTPDRGQTWSAAVHEPDALEPADDVPDDQTPEPLKAAPTQTAMLAPNL